MGLPHSTRRIAACQAEYRGINSTAYELAIKRGKHGWKTGGSALGCLGGAGLGGQCPVHFTHLRSMVGDRAEKACRGADGILVAEHGGFGLPADLRHPPALVHLSFNFSCKTFKFNW